MILELSKRMAQDLYPIVVAKRTEIFKDHVTVSALKEHLNVNQEVSLYAAAAILYKLEADGYISQPLAELDYMRKLLK